MLFCVTASHHNTDLEVLGQIAPTVPAARELIAAHDFVHGVVALSTCNRVEVYLDIDEPVTGGAALAREAVLEALTITAGPSAQALRESAQYFSAEDVVQHLFSVSSGLDSMVVGEEEITGQVQRALQDARRAGSTSASLEQVFQRASHATRQMRATADVGAGGRSIARLALDLVGSRITDWSQIPVLLVGTGTYAATTIAALQARGAHDIRVFSATGRAARFAAKYGVRAESDLRQAIGRAELVITCTSRYLLTAADIPNTAARIIVDLGLPRNVHPEVASVPGVELMDLELIGRHASLPELGPGAHRVVGHSAAMFSAEQAAAPAVIAWRRHIQDVLNGELERVTDESTRAALRHLASVISHVPSVRAREHAAAGHTAQFEQALATVFGIEVDQPEPRAAERTA